MRLCLSRFRSGVLTAQMQASEGVRSRQPAAYGTFILLRGEWLWLYRMGSFAAVYGLLVSL